MTIDIDKQQEPIAPKPTHDALVLQRHQLNVRRAHLYAALGMVLHLYEAGDWAVAFNDQCERAGIEYRYRRGAPATGSAECVIEQIIESATKARLL